ncbi:GCK domain-containing protein [Trifolium medium]|uniref:GCK domain-containing protein n=1 Tax=Trifolium medium TaxID=97028 RepID=A0A392PAU9_9FABA|nr:GCK domain-containing protein [Trifolium medium]
MPPKQAEKEQSIAEAANLSPEQSAPEAPKAKDKEEEGDCGFWLFMKGDGCRDTLVDWENCVKEAKENKEDLAEKCSQVTTRLLQCMDYYRPIIRAEKHVEEKAVIEVEKEKQDSIANNIQQEAPSLSNQT